MHRRPPGLAPDEPAAVHCLSPSASQADPTLTDSPFEDAPRQIAGDDGLSIGRAARLPRQASKTASGIFLATNTGMRRSGVFGLMRVGDLGTAAHDFTAAGTLASNFAGGLYTVDEYASTRSAPSRPTIETCSSVGAFCAPTLVARGSELRRRPG